MFNCSVRAKVINDVIKTIDKLSSLAPLHNPPALMGIVTAKQLLPNATQVAVFDTAFHQTMPDYSYRYAVPNAWYKELGVRRYGFHGTSHLYVSKRAAAMLGKPANKCNLITMHIGSGASATAIRNGISVDTSLGMTPLAGLTMGTRPGDLDPGVVLYVMEQLQLSPAQMQTHLSKDSGLKGITECFVDRRDVEENKSTNDLCRLAIDTEVHNVKKYIGAYMAELGHVDAIIFTAGVGENDDYLREKFCEGLEELGIKLNKEITFINRPVISSATITAQWSYCGYLFLSVSQYSIVLIMWLGSVAPNCTSTSYRVPSSSASSKSSDNPSRSPYHRDHLPS